MRLPFAKCIFAVCTFFAGSVYSGELSSRMVSTGWLRSNLSKGHVRILDTRSINEYNSNHILGAMHINTGLVRLSINGLPGLPISPHTFSTMLSKLGIDEKSTVLIYGGQGDLQPFYLLWLFDYIGHKDVALLEGGYEKWERENRPISNDFPIIQGAHYRLPKNMVDEIRADRKEVFKSLEDNSTTIVDVEFSDVYSGIKGVCKRKGHIKGALNCYWKNDIDTWYLWRNFDTLKKTYRKAGIQQYKKITLVSQDVWSAAHSYFTLRYIMGYPGAQIYDGGMVEWANFSELPMETSNLEVQTSISNF